MVYNGRILKVQYFVGPFRHCKFEKNSFISKEKVCKDIVVKVFVVKIRLLVK